MGSYTSKMQLSYFESVDPKRLYQLYSIPDIAKYSNSTTFNNRSSKSIIQQIIPSQQLQQIQHNLFQQLQSNPNDIHHQKIYQQYNNELIFIISEKKNKVLSISHFNKIITFILALKFSYHNLIDFGFDVIMLFRLKWNIVKQSSNHINTYWHACNYQQH